ncbi:DUF5009 domain-containing protein [Maribellus sp. YY47]|uniref:DUF5009 domain-containing protein n=1 Tax=Maribellus sp. YY47 TaxID=2929486 RepID=UPI002000909E|nr:DUF5009 domain-containing protein [Maribellus sp. YY47]MCK3684899.1 DUF5009 domain-containing protein [Maribellus sp. YY47]
MTESKRVLSIDVMRGITLFLMLFVNDLNVAVVPEWLTHRPAGYDGMGLADWVFPGFLFMVGMAVPFAVQNRFNKGESTHKIVLHIIIRTISLLLIGVLMLNSGRLNPDLAGISKNLWAILMYVSVFMIWNRYPSSLSWRALVLKAPAVLLLVYLIFKFRSGTEADPEWLVTGWWGILGLIGWGYLAASLTYLLVRDSLIGTAMVWGVFLFLNIINQLGYLQTLDPLRPVFGIILEGNVPLLVVSGLFVSLLLRKLKQMPVRFIVIVTVLGISLILLGFFLRNWFIISKIKATPSWGAICSGISVLVFVLLYIVIDKFNIRRWTDLFVQAGKNSLTTYLFPSLLYYIIWSLNLPFFFYKNSGSASLAICGSVIWACLMLVIALKLGSIKIQLKL